MPRPHKLGVPIVQRSILIPDTWNQTLIKLAHHRSTEYNVVSVSDLVRDALWAQYGERLELN